MTLSRIVMHLARNPRTEFAGGDDHRGYTLTAPLTAEGLINEHAFRRNKADCSVRRFGPEEEPREGGLARRGQDWFFDYAPEDSSDDEPVYRLGEHRFAVGEYVTVRHEHEGPLTYKVVSVEAV